MSTRTLQLETLLSPTLESMGFEWVGCEILTPPGGQLLRIYVDSPKGITLDDCAVISRQLGAVLEVEETVKSHYRLEVSSPGMERPLFKLSHYEKVVGQTIQVMLGAPVENRRKWKGQLVSVSEIGFILAPMGAEKEGLPMQLEIDIALVDKAHVCVDWE